LKLGKQPPAADDRTIKFGDFLKTAYSPPKSRNWSAHLTSIGMMLNDRLSCCTITTAGHLIQGWTAANGNQIVLPDSAILDGYKRLCGYVEGVPATDKGGRVLAVLTGWRTGDIGGHTIDAFASVEPRDQKQVMATIDLFGGMYGGLVLPESAERQEKWSVRIGDTTGPNRGHAINLIDYDQSGVWCITWGGLKWLSWKYWYAYADEAYAIFSSDWADANGAPNGFDYNALKEAQSVVTR
jgi:hypothetical protein